MQELNIFKILKDNLEMIIDSSVDAFYITDNNGNILMVNKSYENIIGLECEELVGVNIKELVNNKISSHIETTIEVDSKIREVIYQKFKSGKHGLLSSTPIFDEFGNVAIVINKVRDISILEILKNKIIDNNKITNKEIEEVESKKNQVFKSDYLIANDNKTIEILSFAKRVAKVDATVLVLGETGVGKEVIAKFIHENSNRSNAKFIKVNCGAIPKDLVESELFGYEKGAFSGAKIEGKQGLFEVSSGGTLFLDEVAELTLEVQVRLLRVLQEKEIVRVGGIKPIKIDVRLIAATNRNLEEMVRLGEFRKDLYYRLYVVPIKILPLRERKEDILPLVEYFCEKLNKKYGWKKKFSSDAMSLIYNYRWSGNVRELKNLIERSVVMCDEEWITERDLCDLYNFEMDDFSKPRLDLLPSLKEAVMELEASLIEKAYTSYGNVRDAAKALSIDSSTFVRKRQKLNNIKNKGD